uniref:Tubulin--tyrosine ligase-like protein 12 SET-like domain-containing protein n=1 Tax=Ciona savignyi TaxID=51511 RepID=H2Z938_CIOSA
LKAAVIHEDGVVVSDSNMIFLIDHAWTFEPRDARNQLCQVPGLLTRMAEMMGFSVHGEVFNHDDDIVNDVITEMWKYIQTYSSSVGTAEEKVPVWYIMDEFGTRVQHSDEPTVAMIPFHYLPTATTYTIMWLLQDLDYADELTRDYAHNERDAVMRKCKLLPWVDADLSDVPTQTNVLPDKSYEERFAYMKETLPEETKIVEKKSGKLKVFLEYHQKYLTDLEHFEIVDNPEVADVIYCTDHIRDFRLYSETRPDVMLGQFPCEQIIFNKDLFTDIAKRAGKEGKPPAWIPTSFNLLTEFPQFVSHFKQREKEGSDLNTWICRPWNLARGLEIHVTNNLDEIIRLRETPVPKMVSKYIEDPVLFYRDDIKAKVKFDLRFNVLLTSVEPLKLFVCEVFLLRPFALNNFDDYQQHFTVMNYVDGGTRLKQVNYDDFIPLFEEQNPDFNWKDVERELHRCIKEFFKSATSRPAPYGIGNSPQSRSMYGIDAMLEWKVDKQTGSKRMQPVLLECNYMPENSRACAHFPDFLNDVFRFLFLGDDVESCNVHDVN